MSWRLTKSALLAVALFASSLRSDFAQLAAAAEPNPYPSTPCGSSATPPTKRTFSPELEIAQLNFLGNLQMPIADQDQIAASLKQQAYSGDLGGVTSELEERVRRAWQQHGYFKVQVHGNAWTLTTGPANSRIAVLFEIDEGQQYRLGGIAFKNNKANGDSAVLRDLFPIRDGDIFDSAQVSEGLEKLSRAYGQFGYINFTSVPDSRVDEQNQTVWLDIDIDEGKQFYVSAIKVASRDEIALQDISSNFLLKPGDVYNQRLLELTTKHLSTLRSRHFVSYRLHRDEKAGTVAIDIDLRDCPPA
jgi:outer membrane protein assembly factor BamA